MKRNHPPSQTSDEGQKPARKQQKSDTSSIQNENGYTGFSFQTSSSAPEVQVVDSDINAEEFFTRFVAPRKPCILSGLPHLSQKKNNNNDPLSLTCQDLVKLAGDKVRSAVWLHCDDDDDDDVGCSAQMLLNVVALNCTLTLVFFFSNYFFLECPSRKTIYRERIVWSKPHAFETNCDESQ
jgi:hypothetical protein